jgi:hypothetical protein
MGPAEIATRRAVMARDAGLRRISAVTRWLTAAAVALSGALALIAANAFHGHTLSNTAQTTSQTGVGQTSTSSTTSNGLQPPAQAPAATPAAPVVVSGGS